MSDIKACLMSTHNDWSTPEDVYNELDEDGQDVNMVTLLFEQMFKDKVKKIDEWFKDNVEEDE